ncbi:MAG: magnesium chelatase subunit D family protein [Anaerolineae bacterium]|nr:magnesium chelatase subunit D family protein [Anaerolineae bacterium]
MTSLFPFTAIVAQDRLKRALILNAVHPGIGGVLIRGERGTAKSTAARALAQLLPDLAVVADCPFSCDPDQPTALCSLCQERLAQGETLPRAQRRVRFVELPVSATEDRVVGSLDIQRAIQTGERRFEPGVLAAANRGILYIDEVNLLDDHIVDLLLDVAAMGVNTVEREGVSFSHPARFILIGTMNPEEGELRPQLLDRFALVVTIHGVTDPAARVQVIERRLEYDAAPDAFYAAWADEERRLASRIVEAQRCLSQVAYTPADLFAIAELTASLRVPGHRADLAILKTAVAHAALEGRLHLTRADVALAAELALPHRLRQDPFQDTALNAHDLEAHLSRVYQQDTGERTSGETSEEPGTEPSSTSDSGGGESEPGRAGADEVSQDQTPGPGPPASGDRMVTAGKEFRARRLTSDLDRLTRHAAGRRSQSRTDLKRGHYVTSRPGPDAAEDLALDATLRAAAPYQRQRRALTPDRLARLRLESTDLRRKVRTRRIGNLILFAVDASWSMAATERMAATKGAVLSLLRDAYQRRDRVGLIIFRRDEARLVLPFTNSIARARRLLADLPIGGKTPLARGLWLAWQTFQQARRTHPHALPLLILLTDGAGNVPLTPGVAPQTEAIGLAAQIKQAGVRSVVIDTEGASPSSPAAQLAAALGARLLSVHQLRADTLVQMVSAER